MGAYFVLVNKLPLFSIFQYVCTFDFYFYFSFYKITTFTYLSHFCFCELQQYRGFIALQGPVSEESAHIGSWTSFICKLDDDRASGSRCRRHLASHSTLLSKLFWLPLQPDGDIIREEKGSDQFSHTSDNTHTQCENFRNFLALKFPCMKSTLANSDGHTLLVFTFCRHCVPEKSKNLHTV